jgi:hypothetical protein
LSSPKASAAIVTGPSASAREEAIVEALAALGAAAAGNTIALLLEGVPDGSDRFHDERFSELQRQAGFRLLPVVRIAPSCLCCTGNLTMRVHLNRLLRAKPQRLYIGVSPGTHLAALQEFLSQPPYDEFLTLNETMSSP